MKLESAQEHARRKTKQPTLSFCEFCRLIAQDEAHIRGLFSTDQTAPKPIAGISREGRKYYDRNALLKWWRSRVAEN